MRLQETSPRPSHATLATTHFQPHAMQPIPTQAFSQYHISFVCGHKKGTGNLDTYPSLSFLSFDNTIRGNALIVAPMFGYNTDSNVVLFKASVYLYILWCIFNPACFLRVVFIPSIPCLILFV